MAIIDVNKVINGTDAKVILNGYEKLKENYTKESAIDFLNIYKDMPLSSIFESSRYIFSEPYEGLPFYKSLINENACIFTKLDGEYEKVLDYVNEHVNDMSDEQKEIYESFHNEFKTLLEHTKNTRIYANYIKEHVQEDFEDILSEAVRKHDGKKLSSLLNYVKESPMVYLTYSPFVLNSLVDDEIYTKEACDIQNNAKELLDVIGVSQESTRNEFKSFIECVLCANKLNDDESYVINPNCNNEYRSIITYIESVDLTKVLGDYSTVTVKESDVLCESPVNAVNSLFDDIYERQLFTESVSETESNIDELKATMLESALDIMVEEFRLSNDTKEMLSNYHGLVEEGLNIEEGYKKLLDEYNEICPVMEADEDDDVSDDDIDNIDSDDKKDDSGKKIKAPEPKNKAIATTTKYMDKEAQQFKKRAIRKQKGQEKTNALKAIVALPMNVLKDIQKQIKMIDNKDDERRKNYMTEPGFRKKAFRNMKLAILYGSVANMNLAMIPVVASCRHLSKTKDKRIRNELVRELDTEIKVTEEKINDASANGDQKEKYKLMRIRDQLNAEMVRVRLNSKYV